jgi:hypothetical protein
LSVVLHAVHRRLDLLLDVAGLSVNPSDAMSASTSSSSLVFFLAFFFFLEAAFGFESAGAASALMASVVVVLEVLLDVAGVGVV